MPNLPQPKRYPTWLCLLVPTLAGGLGWGIRGQYGHESGAMVPGALIALTIAVLILPRASGLRLARLAALAAIGFSFGGSMTYGQTLGLSQNTEIRELAYWWGLLGTTIKGGIWVALAAAFMAIALSKKRYGPGEMALLLIAMIALWAVGVWLLNTPIDVPNKKTPLIYFSDYWNAGKPNWKPRQELWGGLLFALAGMTLYLGAIRHDTRAVLLILVGLITGAVGFTFGQSLQAFCNWHAPFPSAAVAPYVDAWKVMEVTFGLINGFGLALGCLLLYRNVDFEHLDDKVSISPLVEVVLFVPMALAMFAWNLRSYPHLDVIADVALTMGIIPIAGIIGGRVWPYLGATLYVVIAIAGLTADTVTSDEGVLGHASGIICLFLLPLLIMLITGLAAMRRGNRVATGASAATLMCVVSIWMYTLLSNIRLLARHKLLYPTPEQLEKTGGRLAFIVESLRSAFVVELTFFAFALVLTLLLWSAATYRNQYASRA
ncbi:MAG: hypothetical protein JXQ73_23145 [Phycisphaerae bacterium]|nr:hypothetical protein [Phycisphaerae bacterium]